MGEAVGEAALDVVPVEGGAETAEYEGAGLSLACIGAVQYSRNPIGNLIHYLSSTTPYYRSQCLHSCVSQLGQVEIGLIQYKYSLHNLRKQHILQLLHVIPQSYPVFSCPLCLALR